MTAVTAAMPHSQPARRRRSRWWFAAAVVVVLAIGAGVSWWTGLLAGVTGRPHCVATALGQTTELDPEQAGNAATIAAVAVHRGLPGRAATIGIATAMQESKLRNLDYGDRDSRGLFQQRPSQGWGTVEQIMDPVYASNAFYDVLVKIEGYQNLPITTAAQQVQRSAFPSAYGDHEPAARILASALSGYSTASLSCVLDSPLRPGRPDAGRERPDRTGCAARQGCVGRDRTAGIGVRILGRRIVGCLFGGRLIVVRFRVGRGSWDYGHVHGDRCGGPPARLGPGALGGGACPGPRCGRGPDRRDAVAPGQRRGGLDGDPVGTGRGNGHHPGRLRRRFGSRRGHGR